MITARLHTNKIKGLILIILFVILTVISMVG